jgi:opacity protein-like surface antigen
MKGLCFMNAKLRSALVLIFLMAVQAVPSVAGIYLGVQVDGDLLKGDHLYDNADVTPVVQGASAVKAMGAVYGGQLGYFYSPIGARTFFFGEVLGLTGSATQQKDLITTASSTKDGLFSVSRKMTMGAALGGGIFINPLVGFYAKLGYEQTAFNFSYTQLKYGTNAAESFSKKSSGINFGGGLIYKMTESIFINAEYTYSTGKKMRLRATDSAINGAKRGYSFTPTEHRLMLKLSYMFG